MLCVFILMFAGCSSKYTFDYDLEKIDSVTVIVLFGGKNQEYKVAKGNWDKLISDLNDLNFKSYSGELQGVSERQIVIALKDGNEEIIDAFRIRKTDDKPYKYKCDEEAFKKMTGKYL